jgi:hypothetical protein
MIKIETKLKKLERTFFDSKLAEYMEKDLDNVNRSFEKLFNLFCDENVKDDVRIKVAALNMIYSTNIINITPVVDKINSLLPNDRKEFDDFKYAEFVDKISIVSWNNKGITYKKKYLSFSSKYVHFISITDFGKEKCIPIYDSYVWKVMIAYLRISGEKINYKVPNNYLDFYMTFIRFKDLFSFLNQKNNYDIDKFLWFYGRELLAENRFKNKV